MDIQNQHKIQTQHCVSNMYQRHLCKDFEYTIVVHTIAFRLCVGIGLPLLLWILSCGS